jgi:SprT protein
MLTVEQKQTVINRVNHFVEFANDHFNVKMELPFVRFEKRGTTAGTANRVSWEVNFNAGLMVDNFDLFMNDTIPHEVAHLVTDYVYGAQVKGFVRTRSGIRKARRESHGKHWKSVMATFGVDPTRCHDMDVSKVAQHTGKHLYCCSACGTEMVLTQTRHNKQQRGRANYSHTGCNRAKLNYVRAVGKVSMLEAYDNKVPDFMNKPAPKKPDAPKAERPARSPAGTKIGRAMEVYMGNFGKSRQDIITLLVEEFAADNITRVQAAGYYQNCKKKAGE